MMEFFVKIFKTFQFFTIFAEHSIIVVLQSPKYTFAEYNKVLKSR